MRRRQEGRCNKQARRSCLTWMNMRVRAAPRDAHGGGVNSDGTRQHATSGEHSRATFRGKKSLREREWRAGPTLYWAGRPLGRRSLRTRKMDARRKLPPLRIQRSCKPAAGRPEQTGTRRPTHFKP